MLKKVILLSLVVMVVALLDPHILLAQDRVDSFLRTLQQTLFNWGARIFWFFGVVAAVAYARGNRGLAPSVLIGVIIFYAAHFIIEIISSTAGRPF
jgi:hypothetical protein